MGCCQSYTVFTEEEIEAYQVIKLRMQDVGLSVFFAGFDQAKQS